jgi:hypothetical protein
MMFKITVVAAATLAAFASVGAHAQEDRWSGVYVGAHGAWADGKVKDVSNPQASTQDIDGWQGGVQVGFNKQSGNFLFGVEGDATFGSLVLIMALTAFARPAPCVPALVLPVKRHWFI